MRLIDLTGQWFGYLEVLSQADSKDGAARWLCKCHFEDCGNEVIVYGKNLRSGQSKRCVHHQTNNALYEFQKRERAQNNGLNPSILQQKRRSNNTTGYKGVSRVRDRHGNIRYRAFLTIAGKIYRGHHRHMTPEAAYQERLAFEKKYLSDQLPTRE